MNSREHTPVTARRQPMTRRVVQFLWTLAWLAGLAVFGLSAAAEFRFAPVSDTSLGLWEDDRPVFVYHHGVQSRAGMPEDRSRSSYFHPLYGLDGEVLTDDFPVDHPHHRGLFWAWPHVGIGGEHYDLWMLKGIRHQFERWLRREAGGGRAHLDLENGWYVGDTRVMAERMELTAHAAQGDQRAIDVVFTWTPVGRPLRLAGAAGKSYGGLTLRYAPGTNTVITTPLGQDGEDLYMTRLPWADLTRRFTDPDRGNPVSGAALFIGRDHPDYPPTWLTRHYGVLCLGWPGVEGGELPPGQPVRCRYRIWVHRGQATPATLEAAYQAYLGGQDPAPRDATRGPSPDAPLRLQSRVEEGKVEVFAGAQSITTYHFGANTKYPYFYPIPGPRSGRSVTAFQTEPYPHHSSLFLGCDRVNGGNYWQEGLDRGRIVSLRVSVMGSDDGALQIEQDCRWERPGAEPPFTDHRSIRISAPSSHRRVLDFDMTLTAATDVRVERSNHSLFSVRMAPDLAVTGGGVLKNSAGLSGEKATFGQPSRWIDARGIRNGITEGLTLYDHPGNPWHPSPWFTRDYGFFSPTPFFWLETPDVRLAKGQTLRLRYRVLVHGDAPSTTALEETYANWIRSSAGEPRGGTASRSLPR